MKLLLTLGFIFTVVIYVISATKYTKSLNFRKDTMKEKMAQFGYYLLFFLLFFVQYWLLTQTAFPYKVFFLIFGLLLISEILKEILSSFTGTSTEEIKRKVKFLNFADSFCRVIAHPIRFKILSIISLITFVCWVVALIIFWSNPIGNTEIYIWYVILIFIIPQFISIIVEYFSVIPIVTSSCYDNDLRETYISQQFTNIIYYTIYFIFPFYLLNLDFSQKVSWLPPFWVFVTLPLVLFLVLGVIPFFIGVNNYKNQLKYYLEWKRSWIDEFENTFTFINEKEKEEEQKQLINDLKQEIEERKKDEGITDIMTKYEDCISSSKVKISSQIEEFFNHFEKNKHNLEKWDHKVSFISSLKHIQRNIEDCIDTDKMKIFLDELFKDVEEEIRKLEKEKSRMAGVLTTVFIAILGFLAKNFQTEIMALLKSITTN